MTDTLVYGSEHVTALAALITALPAFPGAPSVEDLSDDDFPYVVLYVPPGVRSTSRMGGRHTDRTLYFQTTVVAISDDQARWAQGKVSDALAGAKVTVPGRSSSYVRSIASNAATKDQSVKNRTVWTGIDNWSLSTFAA